VSLANKLQFGIKVFYFHPDSIALVQTVEKIRFSSAVMPVGLSPERVNEAGLVGTIAGFGRTEVEPRADELQYMEAKTMINADCRRFFARNSNPFNTVRIFDSMICFESPNGQGICGGLL
jgi:hypothetical protein